MGFSSMSPVELRHYYSLVISWLVIYYSKNCKAIKMEFSASDTIVNNKKYETWPVIYKSGEKQMANLLWYNEGLYVDLPVGYVEDLTQVYDSSVGTIQYKQKIKFPPKLYYPMVKDENDERTEYNDSSQYNN